MSPGSDPLLGSQGGTCCVLIPHPSPCSFPGKGLDFSGIIGKMKGALAEVKSLLTVLCFPGDFGAVPKGFIYWLRG